MLASSSRAFSPPLSTVSSAQGAPSPVQVKKAVVVGHSKQDGVCLKMFLKLSVVVDNVLPGASIPLFPEDNIRITQSKVHPLDERSAPYYYSSTEQPLLQKAAQSLQLSSKSSRHYHTLFPVSSPPTHPTPLIPSRRNRESIASSSTPPPNDERYMGYILVSGYNVTLVLPKEFPPKSLPVGASTESEGDGGFIKETPSSRSGRSTSRPSTMFHKTYLHMMAALEVFVPYVTTPPKGPFLVSIPVPRCLDNHVKLRISTPVTSPSSLPRGSFNSVSSEDETPGWDFLTDPPVSRKLDKPPRKNSYQQSADDEQSDSPSGSSKPGTELIQGAYQSTDVLHVRWAPPAGRRAGVPRTEDGMRRIGIERSAGKTRCDVLGRDQHHVKLAISYEGTCTGLWHPGVATMLGMDIALDVKGRRVSWPEDGPRGWSVSGGNGFGGLHSEASQPTSGITRKASFESTGSSAFLSTLANRPSVTPARGSASLLRAPLPNQNTPDYSFENSPGTTPSAGTPSSSTYFPPAPPGHDTKLSRTDVAPGKAVTLKVNLKLLPSSKNEFSFSVKGTVVVDVEEEDFVPLPAFRVLGADKDRVERSVSSPVPDVIEIGTELPDQPTRTLGLREEVRCEEGVGFIFRRRGSPAGPASSPTPSPTPYKNRVSSYTQARRSQSPRVKVEEPSDVSGTPSTSAPAHPAHLPCVLTTVTPLPSSAQHTHCVRVNIPAYALDADAVEFGLALPQGATIPSFATTAVDVLYASYAGRYVYAEVLPRGPGDPLSPTLSGLDARGESESEIVGEMQFWVVVHLGDVEADSGAVEVVYLVGTCGADKEVEARSEKGKGKAKEEIGVDVLLPCFQLPVSRYEVEVDCPASYDPHIKYSTLPNHHTSHANAPKLTHFLLPAGFFPVLSLSLIPSAKSLSRGLRLSRTRRAAGTALSTLPQLITLVLLYLVVSMGSEVRQVRDTIDAAARALVNGVPYSDAEWGDGADPSAKLRWWSQDQFVTSVSTEAAQATAWEKETMNPATPTINLAEATRVPEKRPPRTETRGSRARNALIPLPAVPFLSWKLPLSPQAKEMIAKGLMKAWYLFRKVLHYPLDPD